MQPHLLNCVQEPKKIQSLNTPQLQNKTKVSKTMLHKNKKKKNMFSSLNINNSKSKHVFFLNIFFLLLSQNMFF